MKIVSLLPSATEIVYLLGRGDQLAGVSHECDFPALALSKPKIVRPLFEGSELRSREIDLRVRAALERGETIYQIDLEALRTADPDLILTQELCDVCAAPHQDVLDIVSKLSRKPRILSLDPKSLGDVLKDVGRVGEATGCPREAEDVVSALQKRIETIAAGAAKAAGRPTVVCLEWLDPLMASGHWVPELVGLAGGRELLGNSGAPARRVPWEQVLTSAPEILILMPCGFAVDRVLDEIDLLTRLPGWEGLPAVQRGRVFAVDGHAYYSRPGPRLVDGLEILAHLVHPELFPGPIPEGSAKIIDQGPSSPAGDDIADIP